MKDKEWLDSQPSYEAILLSKKEYYGDTEAAREFAAGQYARQYHDWMNSKPVDGPQLLPEDVRKTLKESSEILSMYLRGICTEDILREHQRDIILILRKYPKKA